MNRGRRHEQDVHDALVRSALGTPLPPSPPSADPRLLWVSARHARRLRAEAEISQIITVSQIAAVAVVVGVVLRFVKWPALWSWLSQSPDDRTLIYAATGLVAAAAIGVSRWLMYDAGPRG